MAHKVHALNKIKNLSVQELSESLVQNGYGDCCKLIEEKNINGGQFLEISELQLKQWRSFINPVHANRLFSFIMHIKQNPQEFVVKEKNIQKSRFTPVREVPKNVLSPGKLNSSTIDHLAKALRSHLDGEFEDDDDQIYENSDCNGPQNVYGNTEVILPPKPIFSPKKPNIMPRKNSFNTIPSREVKKEPDYPKLKLPPKPSSHSHGSSENLDKCELPKRESDYPRLKTGAISEVPRIKKITPPGLFNIINGMAKKEGNYPKLTRPHASNESINTLPMNEDEMRKLKPKPRIPSPFRPIPSPEPIEYESPDDVDYDPDGYLLANPVESEEENFYEEPSLEQEKSFKQRIINRPLPPPPQDDYEEEKEPKKFIEIITHEKRLQEIIDLKHKYDSDSLKRNKSNNIPKPKMLDPGFKPPIEKALPRPPPDYKDMPTMPTEIPIIHKRDELFFRHTDRKGADILLKDLEDGAYLLRPSRKFHCCLCVKYRKKIYNFGIFKTSDGRFQIESTSDHLSFENLGDIMEHYLEYPLKTADGNGQKIEFCLKDVLPEDRH